MGNPDSADFQLAKINTKTATPWQEKDNSYTKNTAFVTYRNDLISKQYAVKLGPNRKLSNAVAKSGRRYRDI